MSEQERVWIISLIFMGLVTLIFLFVISQTRKLSDDEHTRRTHRTSGRVRIGVFSVAIVVFALVSWFTLWNFPLPAQASPLGATQVVKVVGRQWTWQLSSEQIPVGVPIEFNVTSADVNHDFAVYNPDGRLVAQVQAMPGYVNKLLHTFKHPGVYTIRCLEYCGLGHAEMEGHFKVLARTSQGAAS